MQNNTTPPVTVVVSTRNRHKEIVVAVKSILQADYPDFELLVIDQSDNDLTTLALQPFINEPCFHYIVSDTKGVSIGRNIGISRAKSEFIAITDDDCEVPTGWLKEVVKALNHTPKTGLVFGNVQPGFYDQKAGFIPIYLRTEPFLAQSIKDKNQVRGIAACAGLRRSAWQLVNGFDPLLGAGGPLKACEDGDFAVKILLAGFHIYETPAMTVVHYGFRTWKQGRSLAARNWFGIGAAYIKHLKYGHFSILPIIDYELRRVAIKGFLNNLFQNHKISGLSPIIYFLYGTLVGLITPIDRNTSNYLAIRT